MMHHSVSTESIGSLAEDSTSEHFAYTVTDAMRAFTPIGNEKVDTTARIVEEDGSTTSARHLTPAVETVRVPTVLYAPDETRVLPVVTHCIAQLIRATRSPSHFFTGPFFDAVTTAAGKSYRYQDPRLSFSGAPPDESDCYYTHSTVRPESSGKDKDAARILWIDAPPYTAGDSFDVKRDGMPYADYLLDFSAPVFSGFDELHVRGNTAIVHTNIFHVRLPATADFFLRVLDLQNIIITPDLCASLRHVDVDDLTLTGAVFTLLELVLPPSITRLALGAVAPTPLYNDSHTKKRAWMHVDPSRCAHLTSLRLLGGASWKQGATYACTLSDMYEFAPCTFPLPELHLTMHPVELFDKSYAAVLLAFSAVQQLCVQRFALGTGSNTIVARIFDTSTVGESETACTVDVRGVTEFWRARGIQRIRLDGTFFALLSMTDAKRYYMLFRAVEWEAPLSRTIPLVFETAYPLAYIPPANCTPRPEDAQREAASLSVYIPHNHKIDKDVTAHITIDRSVFATGSFLLFRSEGTMCSLPTSAAIITVDEQPACLPPPPASTGIISRSYAYVTSFFPDMPFAKKNKLLAIA